MEITEKISVKWNFFDRDLRYSFSQFRNDIEFADVTLVCEDGLQVLAHKVVLSSKSPFFMNVLKRNKHPHPLIYMRGVNSENLVAIVDLLYHGEMSIDRENLSVVLSLAEELQLHGFTGNFLQGEYSWDIGKDANKEEEAVGVGRQTVIKKGILSHNSNTLDQSLGSSEKGRLKEPEIAPTEMKHDPKGMLSLNIEPQELNRMENQIKTERDDNFPFGQLLTEHDSYKLQMEQLDEKIGTMMEFSKNFIPTKPGQRNRKERKRICKLCGKEDKMGDIKRHIEAKHFTGLLHLCGICGHILGTRYKLARHKSKQHGKL